MSRYRLYPTLEQEAKMLEHCAHARFIWNLCVEQESWWQLARGPMPRFAERCRQLTEARADNPWLFDGSVRVQQQAIRDYEQAMSYFFAGTHRHPGWRKAGRNEGFRITGQPGNHWDFRRLNRNWGAVRIPKAGWVRFRWSRAVSKSAKSYRVTRNRAGQWHIAFAVIPEPVPPPGNGKVVGIDRGLKVNAALSTGELLTAPGLNPKEEIRLLRLQRKLSRSKRGSKQRDRARVQVARMRARRVTRRKDWAEKVTTDIARRFDVIRVEDLRIASMVRSAKGTVDAPGRNVAQKSDLNRRIGNSGWGLLVKRLEDKAVGRVERVSSRFTSQRCSACGYVDRESRESQALFRCTACGFACNADVNAAKNIAAGHAVKARGGDAIRQPVNRELHLTLHSG